MSLPDKPSHSSSLRRPAGIFAVVAVAAGVLAAWLGLRRPDTPAVTTPSAGSPAALAHVSPAPAEGVQESPATGDSTSAGEAVTVSALSAPFLTKKQELLADPALWLQERSALYEAWGEAAGPEAIPDAAGTNPGASTRCCEAVLAGWLRKDAAAARAWVERRPDGAEKAMLFRPFVRAAADSDLQTTAAWVAGVSRESWALPLVLEMSGRLGAADPKAALQWLTELDSPMLQRMPAEAVLTSWTKADPTAASEHLKSMPAGLPRDQLVHTFATHLAVEDPDSARIWADSISDETLRADALTALAVRSPMSAAAAAELPAPPGEN